MPVSRGTRIFILHAGNEKGWVDGTLFISVKNVKDSSADAHNDMRAAVFAEWFINKLLPNLPMGRTIVMDNAAYHSRLEVKAPTTVSNKSDMLDYIKKNNIEIPVPIPNKKILLEKIREKQIPKHYVVDSMAKEGGHRIIRLPPYLCVLNPIEMMWSKVKALVRRHNTTPQLSADLIHKIRKIVDAIPV